MFSQARTLAIVSALIFSTTAFAGTPSLSGGNATADAAPAATAVSTKQANEFASVIRDHLNNEDFVNDLRRPVKATITFSVSCAGTLDVHEVDAHLSSFGEDITESLDGMDLGASAHVPGHRFVLPVRFDTN